MDINYDILKRVELFHNIDESELESLLSCLNSNVKHYKKGNYLLREDDEIRYVGIIMSGDIQVIKQDVFGKQIIMTDLTTTDIFCETFVCSHIERSPVYVKATSDCTVLYIDYPGVVTMCQKACSYHRQLIENMLELVAKKNMLLTQKMDYLSKRSIRERLFSYFEDQMNREKSSEFIIPFSREDLADYLCVDRSALSRELGKLRREGFIEFKRKEFKILREL